LRNPLADPFLMGTSSGAALGAAISFVLPFDTVYGAFFPLTTALAFLGAIVTVLLVYGIARTEGQTPVVTLLLAGVVMNAVLVAIQTIILTLSPRAFSSTLSLYNWLSGDISISSWGPVLVVGAIILTGMLFSLSLSSLLDTLALGDESAAYLGVHVERARLIIIIVASLITAAAVSISGLIGFVGLITPHTLRLLIGPGHRSLLPAAALGGALFLTLTDLLARVVIAPAVMPVGVFTALVGAPFFLFLLRRSKRDYKW
jgi:iron complex transport system permease protein